VHGTINSAVLSQLGSYYRRLGLKYMLRGLPYERCAELPWVIEYLQPHFGQQLRYLDIGSGESPLPTFLFQRSRWDITCLDKFRSVQRQNRFCDAAGVTDRRRFRVMQADLLNTDMPDSAFDVITCISVIEHFEGRSDSRAMRIAAALLRPGGTMVLSTPVNEPYFAEFYVNRPTYGVPYSGTPVYYQRHYDVKGIAERLVEPSGLFEQHRVYFGEYGFQCFERILQLPKPVRALYAWNTPWLASRFLKYGPQPVSRKTMRTNTASGVIVVLKKPSASTLA